ncbi:MAG: hypothetical protein ACREQZ_13245 [Woeseiaceae bacterium]
MIGHRTPVRSIVLPTIPPDPPDARAARLEWIRFEAEGASRRAQ